jgi:hypothetical protein
MNFWFTIEEPELQIFRKHIWDMPWLDLRIFMIEIIILPGALTLMEM